MYKGENIKIFRKTFVQYSERDIFLQLVVEISGQFRGTCCVCIHRLWRQQFASELRTVSVTLHSVTSWQIIPRNIVFYPQF